MSDVPVKKRVESRRALSKIAEVRFPDARLFPLDSEQDATLLLRHLGSQRQRKLGFRSRRSHLIAQNVTFSPNGPVEGTDSGRTGLGTLCVSGYVRGHLLGVHRLVHISGHGDFQLSQIDAPSDPLPLNLTTPRTAKPGKIQEVEMQVGVHWLLNTLKKDVTGWVQFTNQINLHIFLHDRVKSERFPAWISMFLRIS